MEAQLKEDILHEAERYGGAIMVVHETNGGKICDIWEHITRESVQTPLEFYKGLESAGLPVKMQYSSLIARASLSYALSQLKANARSVTTTLPYPNSRSLKSRIVVIRRSHPVTASLSTALPNGSMLTEVKRDEKLIIVIDNYDSFTFNL
ncbi:hypothetical protein FCM35_KLT09163 [Carex littledalei]|uniref:Uncharacterized protein n=1 Tax=Carex littledalei TaxID=544730 RepID=A0A833VJX6_9POAL|nr:hypothetical protein FCM35_KLT09163 [Carex littledalei]